RVKPGDVLVVPGRKGGGRVAVLTTARRRGGDLRLRAIRPDRRLVSLGPRDFPAPPRPLARVELPSPYAPPRSASQRHVASALASVRLEEDGPVGDGGDRPGSWRRRSRAEDAQAKAEMAAGHPVAGCPDLRQHVRAADRADRLARDAERLERRIR